MSVLPGYIYAIIGGFVAGRVWIWALNDLRDDPMMPREDAFWLAVIITAFAWAAWPLAWGIMRASAQGSGQNRADANSDLSDTQNKGERAA